MNFRDTEVTSLVYHHIEILPVSGRDGSWWAIVHGTERFPIPGTYMRAPHERLNVGIVARITRELGLVPEGFGLRWSSTDPTRSRAPTRRRLPTQYLTHNRTGRRSGR